MAITQRSYRMARLRGFIAMLLFIAAMPLLAVRTAEAGIQPGGDAAWLVIASRTRASDAISLAQQQVGRFPGTTVFQSSNGFFAVSLGWADRNGGQGLLASLIAEGAIPADSYFHNGERFIRAIWSGRNAQTAGLQQFLASTRISAGEIRVEPPVIGPAGGGAGSSQAALVSGLKRSGDNFLSLRSGPGSNFREIARMREGTRMVINLTRSGWVQVTLENGMSGWAFGKYVTLDTAPPPSPEPHRDIASNVPEVGPSPARPEPPAIDSDKPAPKETETTRVAPPETGTQQPAKPVADQKRLALVVGNSGYLHTTELPNPANDARLIAGKLAELGFEVINSMDATKVDMEAAIRQFVQKLPGTDVALFFYAGHGMQVNGVNYLIPIDAKLEDSTALDFETIDLNTVLNFMNQDDRISIALLDACRDNPLSRRFQRSVKATRSAFIGRGLAAPSAGSGEMLIGFATAPGEVALDGSGSNSPFSTALARHIGEKGVDIEVMLKRVKAEVYDTTNKEQEPWHNSALRREFYFNPQ
ncbi:MAG: caspase family protein [Nitratireductor sp.]|nr:caspase family protein [Nitratireductor sp.]